MKIYTNELGHMTNMAIMPICGKNLTILQPNFIYSLQGLQERKIIQMVWVT